MGHAHVISHIDLRQRLKQAQQLANQIMFVRERAFCEVTPIAIPSSPRLRPQWPAGRQSGSLESLESV